MPSYARAFRGVLRELQWRDPRCSLLYHTQQWRPHCHLWWRGRQRCQRGWPPETDRTGSTGGGGRYQPRPLGTYDRFSFFIVAPRLRPSRTGCVRHLGDVPHLCVVPRTSSFGKTKRAILVVVSIENKQIAHWKSCTPYDSLAQPRALQPPCMMPPFGLPPAPASMAWFLPSGSRPVLATSLKIFLCTRAHTHPHMRSCCWSIWRMVVTLVRLRCSSSRLLWLPLVQHNSVSQCWRWFPCRASVTHLFYQILLFGSTSPSYKLLS